MMSRAPALEARDITKNFGRKTALDHLSFSIPTGRVVGLLGRNGAGKSTLLRILSCQLYGYAGEIFLFGRKPDNNPGALSRLCIIGDKPDFGHLVNMKELLSVCEGLYPNWDKDEAARLMELFELNEKQKLKGFSRGMQTAAGLIIGLSAMAELTVFDEPSLGLDAVIRERFYDALRESWIKKQRAILLSTHLIDEVAPVLQEAVMIDHGRLLCQDTIANLAQMAVTLSGPGAAQAAQPYRLMKREEQLDGSAVYTVAADIAAFEGMPGVKAEPVSLQHLFVILTQPGAGETEADN